LGWVNGSRPSSSRLRWADAEAEAQRQRMRRGIGEGGCMVGSRARFFACVFVLFVYGGGVIMKTFGWVICFLVFLAGPESVRAVEAEEEVKVLRDIVYAAPSEGSRALMVDLYLPTGVERPPLVLFIHGGGWKGGTRTRCQLAWLARHGYAVASIDYRLSQEALFPAQIHDCKGALRWLRDSAHEKEYGYDAERVVVAGRSAGGHLAALLGTSGGVAELEGDRAGPEGQSSRVAGVIDYFGPTDFILRSEHQPSKTDVPAGSVYKLLGGPVREKEALARLASPAHHVSADDPPLLMLHGEKDETVYLRQSKRLLDAYHEEGLKAQLHIEPGAGHGWKMPTEAERGVVLEFLEEHLRRGRGDD
jgi:acetyl esterase/lipase